MNPITTRQGDIAKAPEHRTCTRQCQPSCGWHARATLALASLPGPGRSFRGRARAPDRDPRPQAPQGSRAPGRVGKVRSGENGGRRAARLTSFTLERSGRTPGGPADLKLRLPGWPRRRRNASAAFLVSDGRPQRFAPMGPAICRAPRSRGPGLRRFASPGRPGPSPPCFAWLRPLGGPSSALRARDLRSSFVLERSGRSPAAPLT